MNSLRLPVLSIALFVVMIIIVLIGCSENGILQPELIDTTPTKWISLYPKPQGNQINSVDMIDDNTIVAVGHGGTIIRSTDAGVTWSHSESSSKEETLLAVSLAQTFGLAIGELGSLQRTLDGGQSWQYLSTATFDRAILSIAVIDDNVAVITGAAGMIRRTTDCGNTWVVQDSGTTGLTTISFLNADLGVVAGSVGDALWTEDGGITWQKRTLPPNNGAQINYVNSRSISLTSELTAVQVCHLYAANDGPNAVFYTTADGGQSWQQRLSDYTFETLDLVMVSPDVGYAMTEWVFYKTIDGGKSWENLWVHPRFLHKLSAANAQSITVAGAFGVVMCSQDGGQSWLHRSVDFSPNSSFDYCSTVSFSDLETGYIGRRDGLFQTTDGGETWVQKLDNMHVTDLHFIDSATGLAACDGWDNLVQRTTDHGETWTPIETGIRIIKLHMANAEIGLGTGNSGMVHRTIDGGLTWTAPVTSPTGLRLGPPFLLNPQIVLILGQRGKVYRSTNGGVWSWETIQVMHSVAAVDFNDDRTIGLVVGGAGDNTGAISRTTDKGKTWQDCYRGPTRLRAVNFVDDKTAYAVGSGGTVLKTIDSGLTWILKTTHTTNNLSDVHFADPTSGIAVGEGGTVLRAQASGL